MASQLPTPAPYEKHVLRRCFRAFVRAWRERQQLLRLLEMTDYQLRDIGVTRVDAMRHRHLSLGGACGDSDPGAGHVPQFLLHQRNYITSDIGNHCVRDHGDSA